ncbi:hypothetical protein LY76DRAFT_489172, partial [Colletotrichum caudatum]
MKFLTLGLLLTSTIVSVSSLPTDIDSRAVRYVHTCFQNDHDQHLEDRDERRGARDISVPSFAGVETTTGVLADLERGDGAVP